MDLIERCNMIENMKEEDKSSPSPDLLLHSMKNRRPNSLASLSPSSNETCLTLSLSVVCSSAIPPEEKLFIPLFFFEKSCRSSQ
jgi:hypothetical protein